MRIAKIIGTVTLSRCHPSFIGARLKLGIPLTYQNLMDDEPLGNDCLVVWDDLGAGYGSRVALSEGGEAAQPFRPEDKPVDAYNAAILDAIHLQT